MTRRFTVIRKRARGRAGAVPAGVVPAKPSKPVTAPILGRYEPVQSLAEDVKRHIRFGRFSRSLFAAEG